MMKMVRTSIVFLLVALWCRPSEASTALFTESFPVWGSSRHEVLYSRSPVFVVGEESVSLLFDMPVYALLTEETVEERSVNVLYSFLDDRLIEYTVSFREEENAERVYRQLRTKLQRNCHKYDGPYFPGLEDVFIDREHTTLYLLVAGRNVFLFVLDAAFYAACRRSEDLP